MRFLLSTLNKCIFVNSFLNNRMKKLRYIGQSMVYTKNSNLLKKERNIYSFQKCDRHLCLSFEKCQLCFIILIVYITLLKIIFKNRNKRSRNTVSLSVTNLKVINGFGVVFATLSRV